MNMRLPVLQVNHAHDAPAAHQRDREKGFEAVLGKLRKALKAGILPGLFRDSDRFGIFRDPSRNALPHAQFQVVYRLRMGILGSSKHKLVAIKHVNQAGIAPHQSGGKFDDTAQHFMKSVGRSQAHADFMKHIYMRVFDSDKGVHELR